MKILHIIHVYPPEHAPAGVNAEELAEELAKMGHHITVMTGWPNHPAGVLYPGWKATCRDVSRDPRGFRLVRVGHSIHPRGSLVWRMWYYLTFALSTLWWGMARGRIDVILCESTPIFGPLTAWVLSLFKGARLVYRIHDVHPESALNAGLIRQGLAYRAMRAMDTFVCRRAAKIVTLTESMAKCLRLRGLPPEHVVVARHWVDGSKIRPSERDNAWRRAHGIPLDRTILLHAGTIGYISGAEVIIRAAAKFKHRTDLLFLFVGDGPLRGPCEKLASQLGVTAVSFLPFQPAEVLNDVQATGDIGLVTLQERSGDSSIPSKMHGYTAAGRPVIASVAADSPTAEIIREGQFGIVTDPENPDALAAAIDELSADPARAEAMGGRARASFLGTFERATQTARLESLLRAAGRAGHADGTGKSPGAR